MIEIKLNSRVFDKITSRRGKVTGSAIYLYDQDQYLILFDGEKDEQWCDSGRISPEQE